MPVSGSSAVTLIDLLRKPPDSSSAKSTGSSGQFQAMFQRVSTDSARPSTSPDAAQPTIEVSSTPATATVEGVRDAAPVDPVSTSGIRAATGVDREAMPRDAQVAAGSVDVVVGCGAAAT